MTQSEFIEQVATAAGTTQAEVGRVLEAMVATRQEEVSPARVSPADFGLSTGPSHKGRPCFVWGAARNLGRGGPEFPALT